MNINRGQSKRHVVCKFFVIFLGIMIGSVRGYAETELKFENAVFFSDKNNQQANSAKIGDGRLYLAGSENAKSLVVSYQLPPGATPLSSFRWQNESGSSTDVFYDIAFAGDGFCAAGSSAAKGKSSEGLIAKSPLDPSSAAIWSIKPEILAGGQRGVFKAVLTNSEIGVPYHYVVGSSSTDSDNRTATFAKIDKDGRLLWSRVLSSTEKRYKASGTSIAVLNGFIYVSGYSGKGEKGVKFNDIPLNPTLWKYDFSGQQIWMKTDSALLYAAVDLNLGPKVDMTVLDSYLYLALVQSKNSAGSILILKYDQDGEIVWKKEVSSLDPKALLWDGAAIGIAGGVDRLYVAGMKGVSEENAFLIEMEKEYGFILAQHNYGDSSFHERVLEVEAFGKDVFMAGVKKSLNAKSTNDDLMLLHYTALPVKELKIQIHPNGVTPPQGTLAVVIFSESSFDAVREIKQASLTFGVSGNEPSWDSCTIHDNDQDGRLDLLCYFKTQFKFQEQLRDVLPSGVAKGILKGQLLSGERILGSALIPSLVTSVALALPEETQSEPIPESTPTLSSTQTLISEPTTTSSTSTTSTSTDAPVVSEPTMTTSTSTTTTESASSEPLTTTMTSSSEPSTTTTTSTTAPLISEPTMILSTSTTTSSTSPTTTSSTTNIQTTSTTSSGSSGPVNLQPLLPAPTIQLSPKTTSIQQGTQDPLLPGKPASGFSRFNFSGSGTLRSLERGLSSQKPPRKDSKPQEARENETPKYNPELARAYQDLGKQALMLGNLPEAIKHYKEALEFDPKSAKIQGDLGVALMKEGRLEESREYLTKALELEPDNVVIRNNLEKVLSQIQGSAKTS